MNSQVSPWRRTAGRIILVVGLLLFLSIFVSATMVLRSGDMDGLEAKVTAWGYRVLVSFAIMLFAHLVAGVRPSG